MAPNLKHQSLLLQTIDLDLVESVKAGFPPLTSQAPAKASQPDGTNYWEWSADAEINSIVDQERLSADHIVDNIVRQSLPETSSTVAANDQYWDFLPAQQSTNYFNWPASADEQLAQSRQQGSSESYWAW